MDTKKIQTEYHLAQWSQIIRERKESGLSIKEYCEKERLSSRSYYYWLKKLREITSEQLTKMQEEAQTGLVPKGFTEVKIRDNHEVKQNVDVITIESSKCSTATNTGQITINITNCQITADGAYPTNKLSQLLKELIQPC